MNPTLLNKPLTEPRLVVRLDNVAANYRLIRSEVPTAEVAGVVKADGYGLGADLVAATLAANGCETFFVARISEGIALRASRPEAEIFVFDGAVSGATRELVDNNLTPVLNTLGQVEDWQHQATAVGRPLAAAIHIDTGMLRLGLDHDELARFLATTRRYLNGIELRYLISHLASADVAGSEQSRTQREAFNRVWQQLGGPTASLANSAGIFLGTEFHYDLVRPGIALYGGSPTDASGRANPMAPGVELFAPIIGVRNAERGETVGYGATHRVEEPARIATVATGYADGFVRSSSGVGSVVIGDRRAPIVGRVSMDLITVDVTDVDDHLLYPGAPVELLGYNRPIDEVASEAGTISYEILVRLAQRLDRHVIDDDYPIEAGTDGPSR